MLRSLLLAACLILVGPPIGSAKEFASHPDDNWQQLSKIIADKSIDPNWRAADGRSIVLLQLTYGSEETAVEMIKRAERVNVWKEGDDGRLMTIAIMLGSQAIVRVLLSLGETPNNTDSPDDPPLITAAVFGRLEIMRMLIKAGAKIDQATPEGATPIIRALVSGKPMAARLLVDAGVDLKNYSKNELSRSLVF